MVESESGMIPEGWEVKELGEVCEIKYGKGLPKNKLTETGYNVYGANGIIGYYKDFLYEDQKVLISCRGAASGKVIVSEKFAFVTSNSLVLEEKEVLKFIYFNYLCKNTDFKNYVSGSAQPQITIEAIFAHKLIIPEKKIQIQFEKIVKNNMLGKSILLKENDVLKKKLAELLIFYINVNKGSCILM